jgi:hypothetical protein
VRRVPTRRSLHSTTEGCRSRTWWRDSRRRRR